MRIAIIGSGISGHGAAYRLRQRCPQAAVTLFEKAGRPGGHSASVEIDYDGQPITVDTGFIVYNVMNYPLLTSLFGELGVATQPSDMSFSLSLDGGAFEWSGQDRNRLSALFAQRSNMISPRFWRMVADIVRFNGQAAQDLRNGTLEGRSLGAYLAEKRFAADFRDNYILPMGGAIWSMAQNDVLGFPAQSFVAFFDNHRLLNASRPQWRTVTGGSRVYVDKLIAAARHTARYGDGVVALRRPAGGVVIETAAGHRERFDAAILATHSDTALALLADAAGEEAAALGAIRYAQNAVYLHRDAGFMPKRRAAWAAWNVRRVPARDADPVTVTYWMNRLQGIADQCPLFVTLNPPLPPDPKRVFGRYVYAHPQYDRPALEAQRRIPGLQGRGGVYFAGAWLGHGFHEDGLRSGFDAADRLIADRVTGAARPAPAAAL